MTGLTPADTSTAVAMPLAARVPRILVIGYGNPDCRDDGLGPAAVAEIEKIGWPNVTTSDNYQLVFEDAVQIATHDVVWFIDAAREGDVPCTLRRISAALDSTSTGHLLNPETVLAIADQQFGKCPEAHLVSIRGYEFDFHEGLSDWARSNLALAVTLIRRRIGHLLKVSR